MKIIRLAIFVIFVVPTLVNAQSTAKEVKDILNDRVQTPDAVTFQLQQYLLRRVPNVPTPSSGEQWTAEADRIRRHVLNDVIFHGWPKGWVNSPPKFEDAGPVPGGVGYRMRKLRYEIVPGFWSTAILYEPANLHGKVPAVLNVNGHDYLVGKAADYKQKRCINQALRGMIALNLEWLNTGELHQRDNDHAFGQDLDLVGANGVGLFYLAMRRGLDYLYNDPQVDPNRIAVTGLSGGGWQTIILSSLDKRVKVAIPVAGYTSLEGRVERTAGEWGDFEQVATDLLAGQGYETFTAMRAPRPTLLINNAEDDCCFRAPLVRPYIFTPVVPFFRLYGEQDAFEFHSDTEITAHNYGLDNRQQAYRFLTTYFHLPVNAREIPVDNDIKTYSELEVGVPKDNLTILGLARQLASEIRHKPIPDGVAAKGLWSRSQRENLSEVVRYTPVVVEEPWFMANTDHNAVQSMSFRFQMSNGLSATGVWIKATSAPKNAPLTIVLNDKGKKDASLEVWDRVPEVADRVDRGEQVIVADLLFTGDAAPCCVGAFEQMLAATGVRPLGMEAAQLIGLAHWAQQNWQSPSIRLETSGMRMQVVSLVASALEPHLFSVVHTHDGIHSLNYLLSKPVTSAPDLFCLDLYKYFDIDSLVSLAEPTKIVQEQPLEAAEGN